MDRKLLRRLSKTTVIANEINSISKWFAMTGFSVLCIMLELWTGNCYVVFRQRP